MHDQADELRRIVLRTTVESRAASLPSPPLVVIGGGRRGVGVSTIAVNVTAALARQGQRVVLVDGDFQQPDATRLCRLQPSDELSNVLSGERTIHESLQCGPAGCQVLPGIGSVQGENECSAAAQQGLLAELAKLGRHADFVIVDAGNQPNAAAVRFWQAADLVLLPTTADSSTIMDSYAAIKTALAVGPLRSLLTVINRSNDPVQASEAQQRLQRSCVKFLRLTPVLGPTLRQHTSMAAANEKRPPIVLDNPTSAPARELEQLAEFIRLQAHTASQTPRKSLAA